MKKKDYLRPDEDFTVEFSGDLVKVTLLLCEWENTEFILELGDIRLDPKPIREEGSIRYYELPAGHTSWAPFCMYVVEKGSYPMRKPKRPSEMTKQERRLFIEKAGETGESIRELSRINYNLPHYAGGWMEYLFRQALFYADIRDKMSVAMDANDRGEVPWERFKAYTLAFFAMDLFCATGHPFYTVTPSLWEALQNTDITDEFDLLSFNPGLPVIEFILPKKAGLKQDSVFEDFYSLRFVRLTTEDVEKHRSLSIEGAIEEGDVYFSVEIFVNDLDLHPLGIAWVVDADAEGAEASLGSWVESMEGLNANLEDRLKIPPQAVRAAVQLAHLLCARKELASGSSVKRTAKRGKKEIRTPRELGKSYGIVRKSASVGNAGRGDGPSKSLHIRRGHYKAQPYGPGRSKRKTIWVEPYWAGGHEE